MTTHASLSRLVEQRAATCADFASLTEVCCGAWPGLIRSAMFESHDPSVRRLAAAPSTRCRRIRSDRRLPLSHPLDADWRFTRDTAETLLDVLLDATPPGGDVLLIAMPTVALAAHDRGVAHRFVVASRGNDPIDTALRRSMPEGRFVDLHALPRGAFATAAIDPPWYDDVAEPLIGKARHALDDGGTAFLCTPDRFTLPSSAGGLSSISDAPRRLGFVDAVPITRVRYETPFFEHRCLEASGLGDASPCWRTGLLIACVASSAAEMTVAAQPPGPAWRETSFGPIRIWWRPRAFSVERATEVTVAGSISRTDPFRERADVWTSGNLIATNIGLGESETVVKLLAQAEKGSPRGTLAAAIREELDAVERTVHMV